MHDIEKNVRTRAVHFDALAHDEQDLLHKAYEVSRNAQAPYSQYQVGVAVLSDQATIHVGCNVERCTWTQTTHAEQNAIDSMVAAIGLAKIEKLAVVCVPQGVSISLTEKFDAVVNSTVCGHCLQIIWENCFNDPAVKVLSLQSHGIVACATIDDLLPFRFGPGNLNISYKNP